MARPKNVTPGVLSPRALHLLAQLFDEKSNLSLPAGVASEVLEIRQFVQSMSGPVEVPAPVAN